jgi:hypothetical protein
MCVSGCVLSVAAGAPVSIVEQSVPSPPDHRLRCCRCNHQFRRSDHYRGKEAKAHCIPRCKKPPISPSFALSALATSPRSHKRKRSSTGQIPSEVAAIRILPIPLPLFALLQQQGWKLQVASRTSRALCTAWLHLAEDNELKQWETKRGGYYQHDTMNSFTCSFLDEKRVRLRHSADRIARELLCNSGVNASVLKLAAIKLLRAFKGDGEQIIHFDIVEYSLAIQCYTVLFYLTETTSTAVPFAPLADLRDCFTEGEKHPSPSAKAKLIDAKLHTERVNAGDSMIINCACPHKGKANPDDRIRFVLFLNYYPSRMRAPDTENQRYPMGVMD